jgi:hypothetical protein
VAEVAMVAFMAVVTVASTVDVEAGAVVDTATTTTKYRARYVGRLDMVLFTATKGSMQTIVERINMLMLRQLGTMWIRSGTPTRVPLTTLPLN